MVTIVNYGIGNLGSVLNMFKKVGVEAQLAMTPEELSVAKKILLPGVGHFDACVRALHDSGLIPALEKKVFEDKVPTLGICVGYQMMTRGSEEGELKGLSWLPADTLRFKFPDDNRIALKVPHMGWNLVQVNKSTPLGKGFDDQSRFYFVHSYYVKADNAEDVLFKTHYGFDFASGMSKANIFGVQFHPEKSHRFGMNLFKNFAEL